ncbi:MAG TPA: membrane-bound lytic murein transglycosylase MltF [Gammaproteobacteria bacterium]|nr:membrane-bound lytic murein transglycosylase MltF [Gammaproteobacteria bacterium]
MGLNLKVSSVNRISQIAFLVTTLFLTACGEKGINDLKKQGELIVLTRNAPTTWYQGRDGEAGFEYDLVQSFAKEHGLSVRFKVIDNFKILLQSIQKNEAQLAAAGITRTADRIKQGYLFGPAYQQVQQWVVCRRGRRAIPKKLADLADRKLVVLAGSSYTEALKKLKVQQPGLNWQEVSDVSTEQLLEQVWKKEIDCTIADSNIISISRRYYPELATGFAVTEKESLAWVIAPKWKGLIPDIKQWLEKIKQSGEFAAIDERYYGHIQLYDYVDNRSFNRRIKTRLPKYKKIFQRAARKYQLPWTLLAAQAYQESHWNPRAKSPTGVRGMMMLTLNTAKAVGVKSRLDPVQSIWGGARYLRKMIKRIHENVKGQDRLWYALAAYNVGYGHLKDAMWLAEKKSLSAYQWVYLKTVLPLLSNKKYYRKLKYGYARGAEPVRYVQRIREYQQILEKTVLD